MLPICNRRLYVATRTIVCRNICPRTNEMIKIRHEIGIVDDPSYRLTLSSLGHRDAAKQDDKRTNVAWRRISFLQTESAETKMSHTYTPESEKNELSKFLRASSDPLNRETEVSVIVSFFFFSFYIGHPDISKHPWKIINHWNRIVCS